MRSRDQASTVARASAAASMINGKHKGQRKVWWCQGVVVQGVVRRPYLAQGGESRHVCWLSDNRLELDVPPWWTLPILDDCSAHFAARH